MIKIQVQRDQSGEIRRFTVEGHAGYAEHGRDIVCAAVSAVTQTAILGLKEVLKLPVVVEMRDGYLSCRLPEVVVATARPMAQAVLETMLAGLKDIQEGYPDFIELNP